MIRSFIIVLFSFFSFFNSQAQSIKLSGKVSDVDHHVAVAFANIGIKDQKVGTLSDEHGYFNITIPDSLKNELLTFSCVGFETVTKKISDLKKVKELNIQLAQKAIALPEFVVSNKPVKPYRIGIRGRTPLVSVPATSYNKHDIIEQARSFKIKEFIKVLNANIYYVGGRSDSIRLRLNFYSLHNGFPGERLINNSIIKTFKSDKGWFSFDLSDEKIYVSEDFAVSFEYLPDSNSEIKPLAFGAKLGAADSFVRLNSQGKWQKNELGGATIYLTVK
ncbi:MAG: carboxypeptidase-like regulatory domain-containing protein [Pelobium sp.]